MQESMNDWREDSRDPGERTYATESARTTAESLPAVVSAHSARHRSDNEGVRTVERSGAHTGSGIAGVAPTGGMEQLSRSSVPCSRVVATARDDYPDFRDGMEGTEDGCPTRHGRQWRNVPLYFGAVAGLFQELRKARKRVL